MVCSYLVKLNERIIAGFFIALWYVEVCGNKEESSQEIPVINHAHRDATRRRKRGAGELPAHGEGEAISAWEELERSKRSSV